MSLTLYFHPFSSYCQKAVMALYENSTPFSAKLIDLSDATSRAELTRLWPIGKFPVLHDDARNETIPESSIIVEYLSRHYPGPVKLIPDDADSARRVRERDRFFDFYLNDSLGKVVGDHFRPAGKNDPHGVDAAKRMMGIAYEVLDAAMAQQTWAAGEEFTMADCAAAPTLFYANLIVPFDEHGNIRAYYDRLTARPSFRRALREAEPYCTGTPMEKEYRTEYAQLMARR